MVWPFFILCSRPLLPPGPLNQGPPSLSASACAWPAVQVPQLHSLLRRTEPIDLPGLGASTATSNCSLQIPTTSPPSPSSCPPVPNRGLVQYWSCISCYLFACTLLCSRDYRVAFVVITFAGPGTQQTRNT